MTSLITILIVVIIIVVISLLDWVILCVILLLFLDGGRGIALNELARSTASRYLARHASADLLTKRSEGRWCHIR